MLNVYFGHKLHFINCTNYHLICCSKTVNDGKHFLTMLKAMNKLSSLSCSYIIISDSNITGSSILIDVIVAGLTYAI